MDASNTQSGHAHRVGNYRLLAELGRGGMAKIFLAATQGPGGFNKLLVVKQICGTFEEDPEFVTMFLDEARLAARLRHPNIVQTHEVGEADGHHFLVMEYLDGQPLSRVRTRLGRAGALPLALHVRALIAALAGLSAAHELVDYEGTPLGVVHRDVSPDNLFVTYDGAVKVVDFGIAKARDSVNETQAGAVKGKVAYMAPEQATGRKLDRRADVFAVGVMLWEAATGTRMWKGLPHGAILRELGCDRIPDALAANPRIPDRLEAIIRRATAASPEERYASAAELQADLEAFLDAAGDRSTTRDLGRIAAEHFAAERAEIKAIIQRRLRGISEDALHAVVRPATPVLDPEAPTPPPVEARARTSAPAVVATPRRGAARAQRGIALAAAALAVAFTVGAARIAKGSAGKAAPPPPIARVVATAPAPAPTPASTTARLHVSASPPEAKLFLDEQPLPSNPFTGELSIGDAEHQLRVEAPDHEPRTERFSLTRDRVVEVALQPARGRADARPEPVAMAAPRTGRKAPAHLIDTANPYAR